MTNYEKRLIWKVRIYDRRICKWIDCNFFQNYFLILCFISIAGNFLRNAGLLIELVKTRSFELLDKLEESLKKETDTWNGIKSGFHDILSSHVKSVGTNITIYKEYACKLEQQTIKIAESHNELREMVISNFD